MSNGTFDLLKKMKNKNKVEDEAAAAPVEAAAPAPPPVEEPVLGINPPEKELPPAPPVGSVEAKPKKGRPVTKKEAVDGDELDAAVDEFAAALKKVLRAVRSA